MLILALESSAKPASAAVYEHTDSSGKLLGQYYLNSGFSHSRTLMVMVESLLRSLNLTPADIDLFAAAHGPGSFTGVRIGVCAAKGLAFGSGKPACGVSSLEALAYQSICGDTLICPVMDARRGHVYNAVFRQEENQLVRLCEDRVISIDDLLKDLQRYNNQCNDSGMAAIMPAGDACALISSAIYADGNLKLIPPPPAALYQSAFGVALCACNAKTIPAAELEPVYLRPSQAERVLNEKRIAE